MMDRSVPHISLGILHSMMDPHRRPMGKIVLGPLRRKEPLAIESKVVFDLPLEWYIHPLTKIGHINS